MLVTQLPRESALVRSMFGEEAEWSMSDHLQAAAVDALWVANWQRSDGKGRRPKPIPRPGQADKDVEELRPAARSFAEIDEFLASVREEVTNGD